MDYELSWNVDRVATAQGRDHIDLYRTTSLGPGTVDDVWTNTTSSVYLHTLSELCRVLGAGVAPLAPSPPAPPAATPGKRVPVPRIRNRDSLDPNAVDPASLLVWETGADGVPALRIALGDVLRARKASGLSVNRLFFLSGVQHTAIHRMLRVPTPGGRQPRVALRDVAALARTLQLPIGPLTTADGVPLGADGPWLFAWDTHRIPRPFPVVVETPVADQPVRVCTRCHLPKRLSAFARKESRNASRYLYDRDSVCKRCRADQEAARREAVATAQGRTVRKRRPIQRVRPTRHDSPRTSRSSQSPPDPGGSPSDTAGPGCE